MPFSNQVDWTGSDFLIAGLLLFVAAFAIEVVLRLFKKKRYQVAIIAVLRFVFSEKIKSTFNVYEVPCEENFVQSCNYANCINDSAGVCWN